MRRIGALLDFDGVIMDTEAQYTVFWDNIGEDYLGINSFCSQIKGQTLKQVLNKHFSESEALQAEISDRLLVFEDNMTFDYVKGAEEFLKSLKENQIPTAMVTSSDVNKLNLIYKIHPELPGYFDKILSAEYFSKSKPDPECYINGMRALQTLPENSYIFEDSLHGLGSAKASGGHVIGLATTYPAEVVGEKAEKVILNFEDFSFDDFMNYVK